MPHPSRSPLKPHTLKVKSKIQTPFRSFGISDIRLRVDNTIPHNTAKRVVKRHLPFLGGALYSPQARATLIPSHFNLDGGAPPSPINTPKKWFPFFRCVVISTATLGRILLLLWPLAPDPAPVAPLDPAPALAAAPTPALALTPLNSKQVLTGGDDFGGELPDSCVITRALFSEGGGGKRLSARASPKCLVVAGPYQLQLREP